MCRRVLEDRLADMREERFLWDTGFLISEQKAALPEILEDLERQLIVRAYRQASGVKNETARLLGIKTLALYHKLEKYGIG